MDGQLVPVFPPSTGRTWSLPGAVTGRPPAEPAAGHWMVQHVALSSWMFQVAWVLEPHLVGPSLDEVMALWPAEVFGYAAEFREGKVVEGPGVASDLGDGVCIIGRGLPSIPAHICCHRANLGPRARPQCKHVGSGVFTERRMYGRYYKN